MWMKVDDGLHNHRKTRAVTKSGQSKSRDAAPMGLWVLAGSWAAQNGTDGWVPEEELDRWDDDWRNLAGRLVRTGWWWPSERDGEPGYGFNDWHDYNDPADLASKSGTYGNHVRWHINEKRVDPECEHCPKEPDDRGDIAPMSGGDRGAIGGEPEDSAQNSISAGQRLASGGDSGATSGAIALPEPDPNPTRTRPEPVASALAERRADVEQVCEHLASRIESNGARKPTITTKWRDAARLMLDNDQRTEEEIHGAIDWSQSDEFWRANILSMPKLRDKYDTLRLQAQRRTRAGNKQQETNELFARAAQRMGITGGQR